MTGLEEAFRCIVREEVSKVVRELLAAGVTAPRADEFVSVATFARKRSISPSTVRKAIREGRLDALRIGRAVRVRAGAEIGIRPTPTADPHARARRKLGLQ